MIQSAQNFLEGLWNRQRQDVSGTNDFHPSTMNSQKQAMPETTCTKMEPKHTNLIKTSYTEKHKERLRDSVYGW